MVYEGVFPDLHVVDVVLVMCAVWVHSTNTVERLHVIE